MKRFEAQFCQELNLYLRLHWSWLVNALYIHSVEKKGDLFQVKMMNGQGILVSRRRFKKYADVLRTKYVKR